MYNSLHQNLVLYNLFSPYYIPQLLLTAPGVDVNRRRGSGGTTGASPRNAGYTALMEAAAKGRTDVVATLLDCPQIDASGAAAVAIDGCHETCTKLILSHGLEGGGMAVDGRWLSPRRCCFVVTFLAFVALIIVLIQTVFPRIGLVEHDDYEEYEDSFRHSINY